MNKGDLVNEVAQVVDTKKEAQAAVDCVFSSIRRDFEMCIKKKRVANATTVTSLKTSAPEM